MTKLVAETILNTTSISNHIKVLTDPKMLLSIRVHLKKCIAYNDNSRERIINKLFTLKYLRENYEAETLGKALSSMAAKHKSLVGEVLEDLYTPRVGSHQQGGELYELLCEYLNQIDDIRKEEATEAATAKIETEKEQKS